MDSPLTVMLPAVRGTPTRVTGYRPDSAGKDSAAGSDSNSTPEVSKPWKQNKMGAGVILYDIYVELSLQQKEYTSKI